MPEYYGDLENDNLDVYEQCNFCGGNGKIYDDRDIPTKCKNCKGTGWIIIRRREKIKTAGG